MGRNMKRHIIIICAALMLGGPTAGFAQNTPDVSQKDVDAAAKSIARYCKILVQRMDGLISEDWATQDLSSLANVWDALNCHQLFGFDPAPPPPASASTGANDDGGQRPRWIVR